MRLIRNFIAAVSPAKANELSRQLSKFEDNVGQEMADIRQGFHPNFSQLANGSKVNGLVLAPGDAVSFDTSATDVLAGLERPSAKLAGRLIAVCKIFGANNLVLVPDGVRINRLASLTLTAVGLRLIYCDGMEYWA